MSDRNEAGFTLIEALVALAVLAVTAVALLGATEAHVARIAALEDRAIAQIAAENRLAEIELGIEGEAAPATLLGRELDVSVETSETADPDLLRLDLSVAESGGAVLLRGFTGFVGTDAGR